MAVTAEAGRMITLLHSAAVAAALASPVAAAIDPASSSRPPATGFSPLPRPAPGAI